MPPFTQSFSYPYGFNQVAQSLFQKYPNDYAQHVVSVDTLSCTVSEDGRFMRTERLIGVSQSAPKWVMKMVGAQEDAYVREITFLVLPSPTAPQDGPALLQASVNLSLSSIVKCIERISYRPANRGPQADKFTIFQQKAVFEAQGRLTQGKIGKALGRKVEDNSWERFDSNALVGRRGFLSVLERMWPDSTRDLAATSE